MNDTPLTDMIDSLDRGWTEETDWAELYVDHDAACHGRQLAATVGELRHWECECPREFKARREMRSRLPLLLDLFEAAHSIPGERGDGQPGSKSLEAPLPGRLGEYDEIMRSIRAAVDIICTDWQLVGGSIEARLEAIRREVGARLANERDDAAAVLAVPFDSALVWLGYHDRPLRLRCDDCGGDMALRDTDVLCGACGRSLALDLIVANGVRLLSVPRCKRGHEPDWRISETGHRACRPCEALRKRAKAGKFSRVFAVGEAAGKSSLTESDIRLIRQVSAAGRPQRETAERFRVSKKTIQDIVHRRTWGHVI